MPKTEANHPKRLSNPGGLFGKLRFGLFLGRQFLVITYQNHL